MSERVFLSMGSNLGGRLFYLESAAAELEKAGVFVIKKSPIYETESWGYQDEPYLNQVLECQTEFSPEELLKKTQEIETRLGRVRNKNGYQARTLDIDILFYANAVINTAQLIVPHKFIHKRKFVLTPLNDIALEFVHPVIKKTVEELLKNCNDKLNVKLFKQ